MTYILLTDVKLQPEATQCCTVKINPGPLMDLVWLPTDGKTYAFSINYTNGVSRVAYYTDKQTALDAFNSFPCEQTFDGN